MRIAELARECGNRRCGEVGDGGGGGQASGVAQAGRGGGGGLGGEGVDEELALLAFLMRAVRVRAGSKEAKLRLRLGLLPKIDPLGPNQVARFLHASATLLVQSKS